MPRSFKFFAILCLCLVMPLTARAQDGNGKIAVVDVEQILNESMAGKSIERQLVNRREAFQKEFAERENNLMNAEKALVEEKNTLTAEEFANKRKAFEKEYLETRNLFQKRRNALDKGLGTALSELRRNIIQVTADIAEEEGYQVVLTRDSVVIVAKEMEITQKVLKRLNKTIQNIKLDMAE